MPMAAAASECIFSFHYNPKVLQQASHSEPLTSTFVDATQLGLGATESDRGLRR